jgi:thymidylate kinase
MAQVSKKLTIFEGPDGGGKSTAGQAFAEATGAKYVHFSALPRVGKSLGRVYVEAMLPALLGYQDVVFDRCWLSEMPYGIAFREGRDRLTHASRRMLERLAMRCGAVVVRCQPGWEAVRLSYMARKHLEMLDNEDQLRMVYDLYADQVTDLPELVYDYTKVDDLFTTDNLVAGVDRLRFQQHPLELASAGNWDARVVLIGEAFAERKDNDAWYQWPFASFSGEGCSQWLADQLDAVDVGEDQVLWLNADQDLSVLHNLNPERVVALGNKAYEQLYRLKITAATVPHPQAFKRFNAKQRYPLLDLI